MKFKTKLYASIGSILVLISIIVIILMNLLEQSTVNMHVVVNGINQRIKMTADIKYEIANIGRELVEIVEGSATTAQMNDWEKSHTQLELAIDTLEKLDTHEESQELIAKFNTLHQTYRGTAEQVMLLKKIDENVDVQSELWNDAELTRQRMLQIAELLHGLQEQEMKNELLRSRETYNWAIKVIYLYLAVGLSLGIGFTIWILLSITRNINKVTSVMKRASNSNVDKLPRIDITAKDEIGSIAAAFNKMAQALEEHSKLEKQLKEEAEEHSWLKTNIAEIATMYPEARNVQMLADLLMAKLVPMVGAVYGIFYMKEYVSDKIYLTKLAGYASVNKPLEYERFQIGEGLIGQCAAEKHSIYLAEVPENYIKIRSGIGEASPKNIIILPVQFEEDVLAVIEIASFKVFSAAQMKLLEEVASNIGITVNSIENHMKAERLLQESQTLTEELQVQSEELQLQQEELRTTNEKLEEQYESSEQKKKELEKVRVALEEKAQQLEITNQYKSEFLANMSHELRTPLNSLLILAQILAENSEGNLTAKQEEYIRTIYSSGNDLLHLINDILDLAKVESGKLDVIQQEVFFSDVADFITSQFSPIARQKNVQFTVQLEPGLPDNFYTDEQRLMQILKNLLSNAFKFTERGMVSLIVRRVIYGEVGDQLQAQIAFSVVDTGIGIAKDKQKTIFEAFKQADGTTSRQYGGTGLGLSISREIANLLGGNIEVNSTVNEGSTFTLYLPESQLSYVLKENTSQSEAAAGLEADQDSMSVIDNSYHLNEEGTINTYGNSLLKDKKILIVDDDIRNVYALTVALEKFEMEIIVAENGLEGMEVLQKNPDTDLVLMDIMMPEIDGFEATRRIRAIPKFQTLPIIALTAKAMKHSREECLEAGATDYISKPINLDQLSSLMQVWLYRKEG